VQPLRPEIYWSSEMKAKRVGSPTAPIRGGENPTPASSDTRGTALAPTLTDRENAGRCFAEEVGRLPGVLKLEQWGEVGTGVPTFHVYLRPDDRDTEFAVYEVKGQVYDRYPESYLDVVVLEATDPSQLNDGPNG
jgi:hypothetical protein